MYEIKQPLFDGMSAYIASSTARFHMPGNKGTAGLTPDAFYDLTEHTQTGNSLSPAKGDPFDLAYNEAAKLYGTAATVYSAFGSTGALMAAVRLGHIAKGRFACPRALHKSIINAFTLLGIQPEWIDIKGEIPKGCAVIVTSPDYYGRMIDIGELSRKCRENDSLLIVDSAHGAHLKFHGEGALHSINCGADISVDSLHKTLPALTGSALLHISSGMGFGRDDALAAMKLFVSTSPSFLINLSTERCLYRMSRCGREELSRLLSLILSAQSRLESIGYELLTENPRDPFRMVIRAENAGEIADGLRKKGVEYEFFDRRDIVFIPSVMNTESDFERLVAAAAELKPVKATEPLPDMIYDIPTPESIMTLREASLAAHRTVMLEDSVGLICASPLYPYPPGVPAVMPGELISKEAANLLLNSGVSTASVVVKP
ncbi:MAG: hypothetical protein ACOX4O_06305 [Eubacteriales bacterium]|jgi:arginine decarboxylase